MTNETAIGLLSLVAGAVLGLIFYGGLWWTVQKGVSLEGWAGKNPALWFLGSQFLRTFTTLAGFYFVSSGDWKRLLLCFVGFVIGRVMVSRMTRSPQKIRTLTSGVNHAP